MRPKSARWSPEKKIILVAKKQAGLFGACQQSLVIKTVDLPLQVAARPVSAYGFGFIEVARTDVGNPHQGTVVRPAQIGVERTEQFPTQWVENPLSVRQVELTKVAEIGCGETLAVTSGQLLSQAFD